MATDMGRLGKAPVLTLYLALEVQGLAPQELLCQRDQEHNGLLTKTWTILRGTYRQHLSHVRIEYPLLFAIFNDRDFNSPVH